MCVCCCHSAVQDMNVRIFLVRGLECMRAQTRPRLCPHPNECLGAQLEPPMGKSPQPGCPVEGRRETRQKQQQQQQKIFFKKRKEIENKKTTPKKNKDEGMGAVRGKGGGVGGGQAQSFISKVCKGMSVLSWSCHVSSGQRH